MLQWPWQSSSLFVIPTAVLLDKHPEMGLLDSVTVLLKFLRALHTVSVAAAPFCIPTHGVQGLIPFSPHLANVCLCFFLIAVILTVER